MGYNDLRLAYVALCCACGKAILKMLVFFINEKE
jgi:hypothetical protein